MNDMLTLIMQGFLENANIGEIQYLCYEDKCWYLCRSIIATLKKYVICWSHDLICINVHIITNANFVVDVLVVILPLKVKS